MLISHLWRSLELGGDSLVLTAAAELLHALSMLLSHMVYILSHLRTQLVTLSGSHTTVLQHYDSVNILHCSLHDIAVASSEKPSSVSELFDPSCVAAPVVDVPF